MQQDRIDCFILAHDEPTFSSAAAKVPMTPQGFAKTIRSLERDLGYPLFSSDKNGSRRPTEFGEAFYAHAKRVVAERALLSAELKRIAQESRKDIRLTCSLGIPGAMEIQTFSKFEASHPNIRIAMTEMPDMLCESMVSDGLYDLALTVLPASKGFEQKLVRSERILLWVHADDPLASRESIGFEDLANRPFAIPGEGFKVFENFRSGFAERGVEPASFVQCSELFWIYQFVSRGKGVGFTLPHIGELDMFNQNPKVKTIPLRDLTWDIGFAWLESRTLSNEELSFMEYLQAR